MKLDPTISIGTLIHLAGILIAGVIFVMKIRQDLQVLKTEINERLGAVETKVNIILAWWQKRVQSLEGGLGDRN